MAVLLVVMSAIASFAQVDAQQARSEVELGVETHNPQQAFFVLHTDLVQKELGLKREQVENISKLAVSYEAALQEWFRRVSRLPPEEQHNHPTTEFDVSHGRRLHEILTADQRLRLREILYQWWGLQVFEPDFPSCIVLTPEQETRIQAIAKRLSDERSKVFVELGLNGLGLGIPQQELKARGLKARVIGRRLEKEAIDEVINRMTPQQRDAWMGLRGREIDLVELDNQVF